MKYKPPTAADLKFKPLTWSNDYPPINCRMCGQPIKPEGALKADIQLWKGVEYPMSFVVCNDGCLAALKGPKAVAVTTYISQEIDRLKKLFPKR